MVTSATTINVDREAIQDLVKVKNEFDSIIESLELMTDQDFMKSYHKAKQQVNNREFVDWNEL